MRNTLRLDLIEPIIDTSDNLFDSVDVYKKEKCRKNILKCSLIFILLSGMNSLSFYVGYIISKE